jgi:hypothetical protein
MNPTVAVNLALTALQAVLQLIAEIKGQTGMTDDEILAQAQTVAQGNDAAYAALKAALTPTA